ncbi:hypothetical protein ACFS4T_28070 [Pseudomonas lini]
MLTVGDLTIPQIDLLHGGMRLIKFLEEGFAHVLALFHQAQVGAGIVDGGGV